MRPPAHWQTDPSRPALAARLLSPLGRLYGAATALRLRRGTPERMDIPLICIGNLTVGGSGKTPTAIAVVERLTARGIAVHVVTRGYGGRARGPLFVDPMSTDVALSGDEALMLAGVAPTWVAWDRAAGARAAQAAGAEAIVMDDGFQNPSVYKDLSIVVVDAARGFGNGRCLPAGPLREPVEAGLSRADMVLSIGPQAAQADFSALWSDTIGPMPHLRGSVAPLPTGMVWSGLPVLAFAGIGYPDKLFKTLHELGADVVDTVSLADHSPLSPALMSRLFQRAAALGAQLVTTEKDAVRLPHGYRGRVLILPVRLSVEDWAPIDAALDRLGS